ncbi:MAG: hypothetical protein ACREJN_21235 [Nitrospiraceae bacterium]
MSVKHLAPGKIKAILYFMNSKGVVKMLPTDEECYRFRKHMGKIGFELMFAETLGEAKKLQKKLQDQLYYEQQAELQRDEVLTSYRRQAIRDRLVARRNSAACNQTERDFIDMWLVIREQKHDLFKRRFTQQIGHLDALEFDNPTNHVNDLLSKM